MMWRQLSLCRHAGVNPTHYLHGSDEIQHLQIPKSDKQMIAFKLILGFLSKGILQKVRANIGEYLKRNDLLTSTDIRNIQRAYNIDLKDGLYHKDDATSVNIWVKQCAEAKDNPEKSLGVKLSQ
ncbi:uncharacterized protein LOC130892775 [Diorhabda carinulata]|uniref:uncharacterized protein LOC130892775 n=1 Tax=Diorhabda carinulata TaxID=1163345 RepID=UPI0025A2690B|nr:uncharacterized protein LOC130892775 [Diorhabda carinulata]